MGPEDCTIVEPWDLHNGTCQPKNWDLDIAQGAVEQWDLKTAPRAVEPWDIHNGVQCNHGTFTITNLQIKHPAMKFAAEQK